MNAAVPPPRTWPLSPAPPAADGQDANHHTAKDCGVFGSETGGDTGRHGPAASGGGPRAANSSAGEGKADAFGLRKYDWNNGMDARLFPPRSLAPGPRSDEDGAWDEQAALQGREAARKSAARAAAADASAAAVAALARTGWGERESGAFSGATGRAWGGGVGGGQPVAAAGGEGRLRGLTSKASGTFFCVAHCIGFAPLECGTWTPCNTWEVAV